MDGWTDQGAQIRCELIKQEGRAKRASVVGGVDTTRLTCMHAPWPAGVASVAVSFCWDGNVLPASCYLLSPWSPASEVNRTVRLTTPVTCGHVRVRESTHPACTPRSRLLGGAAAVPRQMRTVALPRTAGRQRAGESA